MLDALRERRWSSAGQRVLVVCYLFPVYWMVATSLKPQRDIFAMPPKLVPWPPDVRPVSKCRRRQHLDVASACMNSAIIAVGTTMVTLVLAVPAAYGLARLRLRFTVAFGLCPA